MKHNKIEGFFDRYYEDVAKSALAALRFSDEVAIRLRPDLPKEELDEATHGIVQLARASGLRVTFIPQSGWVERTGVTAIIHRAPVGTQKG